MYGDDRHRKTGKNSNRAYQALTIREFDADPDALKKDPANNKKKVEKEGIFTLKDGVALFRPVKTGITGSTDIEILEGLSENDNVVTGPYRMLRTLQDKTRIKIQKTP